MSTTYKGERTSKGCRVRVDGKVLPTRLGLFMHSPAGFEWGYGGSGPAQLALAILAHHFRARLPEEEALDAEKLVAADNLALEHHQSFKFHTVARWHGDTWELTSEQIDQSLKEMGDRTEPVTPNA